MRGESTGTSSDVVFWCVCTIFNFTSPIQREILVFFSHCMCVCLGRLEGIYLLSCCLSVLSLPNHPQKIKAYPVEWIGLLPGACFDCVLGQVSWVCGWGIINLAVFVPEPVTEAVAFKLQSVSASLLSFLCRSWLEAGDVHRYSSEEDKLGEAGLYPFWQFSI